MKKKIQIKKILYCTDLGNHTAPVFKHALAQAESNNATISIVHVVEPLSETVQAFISTCLADADVEQVQKDGMQKVLGYMKKRIENFLKRECEKDLKNYPVDKITVLAGRPSEEILNIAEKQDVDLIVMGKSSNKVRGNRVMGSTARRVNRLSGVPLLIVPNR